MGGDTLTSAVSGLWFALTDNRTPLTENMLNIFQKIKIKPSEKKDLFKKSIISHFKNIGKKEVKEQASIGLDIGTSSIKFLKLTKDQTGVKISNFGIQDSVSPEGFTTEEEKLNAIEKLIKLPFSSNNVKIAVNIPSSQINVKLLKMPIMSDKEIKEAIKWELGKLGFYSEDKDVFDYAVLGEMVKEGGKKLSIIIVTSPKEVIFKQVSLLKRLEIFPEVIDISSTSLTNAFCAFEELEFGQVVAIVEIGHKTTSINIIDVPTLYFVRNMQSISGYDMSKTISQDLNIEFNEAEKLKREYGIKQDSLNIRQKQVCVSLRALLNRINIEIERSMQYFMNEYSSEGINKLILTGGGACLEGIDEFISQNLKIPVECGGFFKNIKSSEKLEKKPDDFELQKLPVALGLALKALEK